jgi:glycerophosphoryl diester phosphodiesterase
MVPPISSNTLPLVVAHRGGAALWAENSITAFRGAIGLGVDLIEFDVHLTRDGKIVVIHDATLDRTTTGTGPVADHQWSELKELRLKEGGHDRILLFDEVIDLIKPSPLGLRMEIKVGADDTPYAGLEAMLAERLNATAMMDRTVVTSFAWETLKAFGAVAKPAGFIALIRRDMFTEAGGIEGAVKMVRAEGFTEMGAPILCLGAESVARARELGLTLGAYGVKQPADIDNALKWGVNVFTTDRPDLAMTRRRQLYGA